MHACDGQMDGQTELRPQDCASIAARSIKNGQSNITGYAGAAY